MKVNEEVDALIKDGFWTRALPGGAARAGGGGGDAAAGRFFANLFGLIGAACRCRCGLSAVTYVNQWFGRQCDRGRSADWSAFVFGVLVGGWFAACAACRS
jgi:hypothetical protein